MRTLRSSLSYANIVASIALFVALGGTSYAAIVVTGKNVRDSSLTSIDIKDRSLLAKDFARHQLPVGAPGPGGPPGASGPQGDRGPQGERGAQGAPGNDAAGKVVTGGASTTIVCPDATTCANENKSLAAVPGIGRLALDKCFQDAGGYGATVVLENTSGEEVHGPALVPTPAGATEQVFRPTGTSQYPEAAIQTLVLATKSMNAAAEIVVYSKVNASGCTVRVRAHAF